MQEPWTFDEEIMNSRFGRYDEDREDALADYAIQERLDEECDDE